MQWEHEADPLVGKLYAIAEGKFKVYENHKLSIRKYGSDEEILSLFRNEVLAAKGMGRARGAWEGTSPMKSFWTVYNHLKARAKESKSGLQTGKQESSKPNHS